MPDPNTILQSRYRIVRQLGQGGMGTVYEAIHLQLCTTVALKKCGFTDRRLRKQFEREARLLANLQHSSLPNVIDHFVEGDGQFLVMQFIAGDDLEERLYRRGRPFPPEEVLTWADQLLDALDYIHTQEPPIVHRDIKPNNLKLGLRGQIVLLDFGLAKNHAAQLPQLSNSGSIFGYTRAYAPLEQIRGTGTDQRTDLYSLAATLHHLMTGVVPVDALTRASAIIDNEPDPLWPAGELNREVSSAVSLVLKKALELKPDRRFTTAAEMRQALRDARFSANWIELQEQSTVLPDGPIEEPFLQTTYIPEPLAFSSKGSGEKYQPALPPTEASVEVVETIATPAPGPVPPDVLVAEADGEDSSSLSTSGQVAEAEVVIEEVKPSAPQGLFVRLNQILRPLADLTRNRTWHTWPRSYVAIALAIAAVSVSVLFWTLGRSSLVQATTSSTFGGLSPAALTPHERWRQVELTVRAEGKTKPSPTFSPDGSAVLIRRGDNIANLYETLTGKLRLSLSGSSPSGPSAYFSPDGKTLASVNYDDGSYSIKLWDVQDGLSKKTLGAYASSIRSIGFATNSKILVESGLSTNLWDIQSGKLLLSVTGKNIEESDYPLDCVLSPSGSAVAAYIPYHDKAVAVYDQASADAPALTLKRTLAGTSAEVTSARFSLNGKLLFAHYYNTAIKLWDVETGAAKLTILGNGTSAPVTSFSPDDRLLAVWGTESVESTEHAVKLFDFQTGELKATLTSSGSTPFVYFSRDGQTIITSSGGIYKVWDTAGGLIKIVNVPDSTLLSPDLKTVASWKSGDASLRLWDIQSGGLKFTLASNCDKLQTPKFSPDGQMILSLCGPQQAPSAQLWSTQTGDLKQTFSGSAGFKLEFSRDSQTLATWTRPLPRKVEGKSGKRQDVMPEWDQRYGAVRLWEAQTGRWQQTLTGYTDWVQSFTFSPDGKTVAVISDDGSLRLWTVKQKI